MHDPMEVGGVEIEGRGPGGGVRGAGVVRERERERGRERERTRKLILEDSSVRSIWTYLTASPCYTTERDRGGGGGGERQEST